MVPLQKTGAQSNTESEVTFDAEKEASDFFIIAKGRLLHVNDWQSVAGAASATFQLTDGNGDEVNRLVEKDDFFKIDIPGPGSTAGDGFDWVRVEGIEEEKNEKVESVSILVRPSSNPTNKKEDIAHFFSDEATSCFMIKREGAKVTAGVYGRNEKPNTDVEKKVDKARNAAVATGAMGGFSKLQWKSLVNGFIKIGS